MTMTDLNTNEQEMEQSMEGMLSCSATETTCAKRKEKRKAAKKDKRRQKRRELAEKLRVEEDARLNDPEEQRRIQLEEEAENQRIERERKEFEERERLFLEELARRKAQEEEEERIRAIEEEERLKLNQVCTLRQSPLYTQANSCTYCAYRCVENWKFTYMCIYYVIHVCLILHTLHWNNAKKSGFWYE